MIFTDIITRINCYYCHRYCYHGYYFHNIFMIVIIAMIISSNGTNIAIIIIGMVQMLLFL